MPIYKANGKIYDIPENIVSAFEAKYPDATVDVYDGDTGKGYEIPVSKVSKFKELYPKWSYEKGAVASDTDVTDVAEARVVGSSVEQQEGWKPTPIQKAFMMGSVQSSLNSFKAHTDASMERLKNTTEYYNRGGAFSGNKPVKGDMRYNEDSGKIEQTYLTPTGTSTTDRFAAERETKAYNDYVDNMTVAGQLRRAGRDLKDLYRKREARVKAIHDKWAEDQEKNTAPLATVLGSQTYVPSIQSDPEYRALTAAIHQAEKRVQTLQHENDRQDGKDVGFWRGFGEIVGDIKTWDFGYSDLLDSMTMLDATSEPSRNRSAKTDAQHNAEQIMLEQTYEAQQVQAAYSKNDSFWHRAGVMTGEMLPFMLDFAIMGGAKGGTSMVTRNLDAVLLRSLHKAAPKIARNKAVQWTTKALGAMPEDLLYRAPLMTNTVQGMKTASDIIDRKLGDVVIRDDGTYDFSNDKTWGSAVWQGEANAIIENYSEMFGTHLEGALPLKALEKLSDTFGAKRLSGILTKASNNELVGIAGTMQKHLNQLGVSDYFGEVGEEYYGQLWRTMLNLDDAYKQNPDGSRTNLFLDGQFHGDIWGGMALSMGLMGAGKYSISAAAYGSMKHRVNKADVRASEIFTPEIWNEWRERIDGTTNDMIGEMAENIVVDPTLTDEQIDAAMNYMEASLNLRGFNLASVARQRGNEQTGEEVAANGSYLEGYSLADDGRAMRDAKMQLDLHRERLVGILGEDMIGEFDRDPIGSLMKCHEDELRAVASDYVNARMMYDGIIHGVRDNIESEIAYSDARIDRCVNRSTGKLQGAVMKLKDDNGSDRRVYVVDGRLVANDDGSINHGKSDGHILICDAETGKVEFSDPSSVLSLDAELDPVLEKEAAAESIRERIAAEAGNRIDGTLGFASGDVYDVYDGKVMSELTVVGDAVDENGVALPDHVVMQSADGTQIVMARGDVQAMYDAAGMERMAMYERDLAAENGDIPVAGDTEFGEKVRMITAPLSATEKDEYGRPFVLSSDGTTSFGMVDADSGLAEAPIRLSLGENHIGEDGKHHGYGLVHIEEGHGEQIRSAGYGSVEEFIENVSKNYTDIREGANIGGNQTYLLELSDEYNNTLFIQLSNDGSYWNVNSAGIFRKRYSRRKPKVYTIPAVGGGTVTDTPDVNSGQIEGATAPAGNSLQTSDGKANTLSADKQADGEDSLIGRSLSVADADRLIHSMEANAEVAPEIALTTENWIDQFGEDGTVDTPIGVVKMGENQYFKMAQQGRNGKLGMVKPTLRNPDIIVEDYRPSSDGRSERDTSLVFVKTFAKPDGSRYYYFTSVTVRKDGGEVIVSNQERSNKRISKLLQQGTVAWIKEDSLYPKTQVERSVSLNDSSRLTESDNGAAWLGVNSSVNGKVNALSADKQADGTNSSMSALAQIPLDENGKPVFTMVDPDLAWDGLVEMVNDAEIAEAYANNMVSIKADALKKAQKSKTRAIEDVEEFAAAEARRRAVIDGLRVEHERWTQIAETPKRRVAAVEAERKAADAAEAERVAELRRRADTRNRTINDMIAQYKDDAEVIEILTNMAPQNLHEVAAMVLSTKKVLLGDVTGINGSVIRSGAMSQAGIGEKERRKLFGLFASAEKGGQSIERLAEDEFAEVCRDHGIAYDNKAARDAIIDVIRSANTTGDIYSYIADRRIEQAESLIDQRRRYEEMMEESFYQEAYHLSRAEYEAMEAEFEKRALDAIKNLDESEYYGNIADEIVERQRIENEFRGNKESFAERESGGDSRSDEVLPPSQSAEAGGDREFAEQGARSGGEDRGTLSDTAGYVPESTSGRAEVSDRNKVVGLDKLSGKHRSEAEEYLSDHWSAPVVVLSDDEVAALNIDNAVVEDFLRKNNVIGAYHDSDGIVYIFAGNVRAESNIRTVLVHENVHALVDMIGDECVPFLQSFRESLTSPAIKSDLFRKIYNTICDTYDTSIADEEFLAYIIEQIYDNPTRISKILYYLSQSDAKYLQNKIINRLHGIKDKTFWDTAQQPGAGRDREIAPGRNGRTGSADNGTGESGSARRSGKNSGSSEKQRSDVADSLGSKIAAAAAEVNTNPSNAQKEAGNYKKGHVQVGTLDVTIEQPVGSVRRGKDADGKEWETTMQNTYGYIRGTQGVDGDHIDVFLSTDIDAWNGRRVVIVDQYNPDGTFDEHKVMLGFNDKADAINAYLANYEDGWKKNRRLVFSSATLEDFDKWIESSHRKQKPYHEYKIADNAEVEESTPENPVSTTGSYTIDTYTTKKNKTYHRIIFPRADKAVWQERLNLAKKMGGTSVPKGYGFKTRKEAEAFAKAVKDPKVETGAKPWSEMNAEERLVETTRRPLTEAEIMDSGVDDVIRDNALDYAKGHVTPVTTISYLNVYEHVRNTNGDSGRADVVAGKTQLGETHTGEPVGNTGRAERDGGRETSGGLDNRGSGESVSGLHARANSSRRDDTAAGMESGEQVERDQSSMGTVSTDDRRSSKRSDADGSGSNGRKRGGKTSTGTSRRNRGRNADAAVRADEGTADAVNELDKALGEFKSLLRDFGKAGRGELTLSIVGMNNRQLELMPRLIAAGVKVGYQLIRTGVTRLADWTARMRDMLSAPMVQEGFTDIQVDEWVKELWDSEFTVDGVRQRLNVWASQLGAEGARAIVRDALEEKRRLQQVAESVEVKVCDVDNIESTLPFLLPQQQEDVMRAEMQFFDPSHADREHAYGKGYMFTNGTGTGKTYTGLGIVKRFVKQGKGRVLILTPSQPKVADWIKDGKNLGLEIRSLEDWSKERGTTATTECGEGVIITTFANFRQNEALLEDEFDLVVYDESHRLMENKDGQTSAGTLQHYLVSNRNESYAFMRLQRINPHYRAMQDAADRYVKLLDQIRIQENDVDAPILGEMWSDAKKEAYPGLWKIKREYDGYVKDYNRVKPELEEEAKTSAKRTKVVFLSATPFNTRANLDYAEGYIFSYPEDKVSNGGYMNPRTRFYLDHFGAAYRFRYHRLEARNDNADAVARQEVEFSDWLQNDLQTMSGRIIDSEYDYSRDFPTVTGDYAARFNEVCQQMSGSEAMRQAFWEIMGDYNYSSALFEAMKASQITDRIKRHIELGRKVVVFHRRQESRTPLQPPFAQVFALASRMANEAKAEDKPRLESEIRAMRRQCADMLEWEKSLDLSMPRQQLAKVFGNDRICYFSGNESTKAKNKAVVDFNADDSGKDIIVVQEGSGKEGISLHDTTGNHQRVCVTLALPQSPITALQIEGRIYRIGNRSNAIFEYPLLGLDMEMILFGQTFNARVGTTENLALGSKARDLRGSFARGVEEHSGEIDPTTQGLGGKEFDGGMDANDYDGFDRAVLDFYGNQKLSGRRDNREGVDYFPTPEPLGYKLSQWGNIEDGDRVLEPSAGHGAIAHYVSTSNVLTAVEPSNSLFAKLQMRCGGAARRYVNNIFENYDLVNKHEVVLMNPPFGSAGKLAVDHVTKAFSHLSEGGRVVAIIPMGSTSQKFEKWYNEQNDAHLVGEVLLPDITFQQAGTAVRCRVVVIDKITKPELAQRAVANFTRVDLSGRNYERIEDFFEDIRYIDMPGRTIDFAMKLGRKAMSSIRELKSIKNVDAKINEQGVMRVSGPGIWESIDLTAITPQNLQIKMLQYFKIYDMRSRRYDGSESRGDMLRQEVMAEMKRIAAKLADMSVEEMERLAESEDDSLLRSSDRVDDFATRQGEFAARERQRMADRVHDLASRLHLDNVDIITDVSQLDGRRSKAKGFYNKRTGRITIVVPNNVSVADVESTLLHEAVAHYGLRKMFGAHFDTFLDNVYAAADESIRRKIVALAAQNGWDFRTATEEYLAALAETTEFENLPATFWMKIKRLFLDMLDKIGFDGFRNTGVVLSDNELRYLLWHSYEDLKEPGKFRSIIGEAEDIVKQSELKVGNYAEQDEKADYAAEPTRIGDKTANNVMIEEMAPDAPSHSQTLPAHPSKAKIRYKVSEQQIIDSIRMNPGEAERIGLNLDNVAKIVEMFENPSINGRNNAVEDADSQKRLRIEKLRKSDPVKIHGNEIEYSNDVKQFKKNAIEYGKTLQGVYINEDTGKSIQLQRGRRNGGLKEILQHDLSDEAHIKSIAAIPEIIRKSIYIETSANNDVTKNADVKGYEHYVCGLQIGNEEYTVHSIVAEDKNGHRYYDHKLSHIEKGRLLDFIEAKQPTEQILTPMSGTEPTIRSMRKVKELIELLQVNADAEYGDVLYRAGESDRTTAESIALREYEKGVASTFANNFDEAWHDYLRSVRIGQEAISKEIGREISDSENVYLAALHKSSVDRAELDKVDRNLIKPLIDIVSRIIRKHDIKQVEIERYFNAKHGQERNEYLASRDAAEAVELSSQPWYKGRKKKYADEYASNRKRDYSGLTSLFDPDNKGLSVSQLEDIANKAVADFELRIGADDISELWKRMHALTDYALDKSYTSGRIGRKMYEELKGRWRWYVPLRGFRERTADDIYDYIGHDTLPSAAADKRAGGRTSEAGNILANAMSMLCSSIVLGNKNIMKQRLLNLATNIDTKLLTISNQWYEKDADGVWHAVYPKISDGMTDSEMRYEIERFDRVMEMAEKSGRVKRRSSEAEIPVRLGDARLMAEHSVRVTRNGVDYLVWVNGNPKLAQAVNGLLNYDADPNVVLKKIENANRMVARNVTAMNANFIAKNFVRDVMSSAVIMTGRCGVKYVARMERNIAKLLHVNKHGVRRGIVSCYRRYLKDKLDMDNEMDRLFAEFMRHGGETGYSQILRPDDYQKRIERYLQSDSVVERGLAGAEAIFGSIEFINRCVENSVRFAAYMTSRQMGKSILRSVEDAKEASVNFNRKGSGAMGNRYARALYIFVNPAIQGLWQYMSAVLKYPKALSGFVAFNVLLGIARPLMSLFFCGDDDDSEGYFGLEPHTRRGNVCIPLGDEKWIKVPLSPEHSALYGIGEVLSSHLLCGKGGRESFGLAMLSELSKLPPIDFVDGKMFDFNSDDNMAEQTIRNLTPTALSYITDAYVWGSDSFSGRKIARKANDFNSHLPEWRRAGDDAVFGGLSRKLNEWSGGSNSTKGFINWNPDKLEYVLTKPLGGIAETSMQIYKTIMAAMGNEDYQHVRNYPVVSAFVTDGGTYNRRYRMLIEETRWWEAQKGIMDAQVKDARAGGVFEEAQVISDMLSSGRLNQYEFFHTKDPEYNRVPLAVLNMLRRERWDAIDAKDRVKQSDVERRLVAYQRKMIDSLRGFESLSPDNKRALIRKDYWTRPDK